MDKDLEGYIEELKKRKKETRVYTSYQLVGLEIAELLKDEAHKSLYIKLAKEYDNQILFSLAKEISKNKKVRNKGAYFMKLFQEKKRKKRA